MSVRGWLSYSRTTVRPDAARQATIGKCLTAHRTSGGICSCGLSLRRWRLFRRFARGERAGDGQGDGDGFEKFHQVLINCFFVGGTSCALGRVLEYDWDAQDLTILGGGHKIVTAEDVVPRAERARCSNCYSVCNRNVPETKTDNAIAPAARDF